MTPLDASVDCLLCVVSLGAELQVALQVFPSFVWSSGVLWNSMSLLVLASWV